jgi:hypothetical protein
VKDSRSRYLLIVREAKTRKDEQSCRRLEQRQEGSATQIAVETSTGVAVKRLANAVAGWVRRPAAPGQRATWPVSAEGEKNLKRGVRLSLSILATKAALDRRALDNRAGPVDAAEPLQTERSRRGR